MDSCFISILNYKISFEISLSSDTYFSYSFLSLLFSILAKATDSWYNDQTYYWISQWFYLFPASKYRRNTEKVAGF